MKETSKDPAVWLKWLEELSEMSSEGEDEDSEVVEDYLEESDHSTSTEEEADDDDQIEEEIPDEPQPGTSRDQPDRFYTAKDGTKWRKTCLKNIRRRSKNIIVHLPGARGAARDKKTEIDIWNLLFDDEVINIVVKCTNIYIDSVRNQFERERDARPTDTIEIRAVFGLLYIIGSLRSSRKNLRGLWDNSKGNGVESCYLSMSEKRFRFLLRCLRFDDIGDREVRTQTDKLAPIREVSQLLVNNFQKYFSPSEYLTVDEQLLAFRGRCGFRQYIPSKPAKYGVKVFALVDCKNAYTLNLEVYVGKQPEGPYKLSTSAEDLVIRLTEIVHGTNRNITGDNWFTSLNLATRLLTEKKLTYVGTIRKNKREIPVPFLPNKKRQEKTSLFGFSNDMTLVSYCPKKNKSVILLSSMHDSDDIDEETGEDRKPEIVTFYNMTKVGVDLVDQLCQKNNVARNTRRWPMVLFYNLLNITAINALCIYKHNNPSKKVVRVEFLQSLSWSLIRPQIERRYNEGSMMARQLRLRIRLLLGIEEEATQRQVEERPAGSRGRCYLCGRVRDRTTRRWCNKCGKWICSDHCKDVCDSCYQNNE